jgi:malate dehydrogenase
LGASGGIGQPLSLLLKQSPLVDYLHLYSQRRSSLSHSLGHDLSHISTACKVSEYFGEDQLLDSLVGARIVVMLSSIPLLLGMSREDLLCGNAPIVADLTKAIARACSQALLCIVTNPINSMVPLASEVLKKFDVYSPKRVMGVTTIDTVRANTFVAELKKLDLDQIRVPVVGGHSTNTIVPLLSQLSSTQVKFTNRELEVLTRMIQNGGSEIIQAKRGCGSATLSMAYATAKFVFSLIRALNGQDNIVECAYVARNDLSTPYFASPILFGVNSAKNLKLCFFF